MRVYILKRIHVYAPAIVTCGAEEESVVWINNVTVGVGILLTWNLKIQMCWIGCVYMVVRSKSSIPTYSNWLAIGLTGHVLNASSVKIEIEWRHKDMRPSPSAALLFILLSWLCPKAKARKPTTMQQNMQQLSWSNAYGGGHTRTARKQNTSIQRPDGMTQPPAPNLRSVVILSFISSISSLRYPIHLDRQERSHSRKEHSQTAMAACRLFYIPDERSECHVEWRGRAGRGGG